MARPYLNNSIKKICERCETVFLIPAQRISKSREVRLQCHPCPKCGFTPQHCAPNSIKVGRCLVCSIPFSIVDHHAKGYCKRDYVRALRAKTLPK